MLRLIMYFYHAALLLSNKNQLKTTEEAKDQFTALFHHDTSSPVYVLDEWSESHCYDVRAGFCLVFTRVWVINKKKATALKFPHFSTSYNSWIHCTRPLQLTFLPTKVVGSVGEPGGMLCIVRKFQRWLQGQKNS